MKNHRCIYLLSLCIAFNLSGQVVLQRILEEAGIIPSEGDMLHKRIIGFENPGSRHPGNNQKSVCRMCGKPKFNTMLLSELCNDCYERSKDVNPRLKRKKKH